MTYFFQYLWRLLSNLVSPTPNQDKPAGFRESNEAVSLETDRIDLEISTDTSVESAQKEGIRLSRILSRIPAFKFHNIEDRIGFVNPGIYVLHESAELNGEEWFHIELPISRKKVWIVSLSGPRYAEEMDASPWKDRVEEMERSISSDSNPSAVRAVSWAISKVGRLQEDLGQNQGTYLSPELIDHYLSHWRIIDLKGLPWCSVYAFTATAVGLGLLSKESDPGQVDWIKHPLQNWHGAAWMAERSAKELDLWIPVEDLPKDDPLTGCLGVMLRNAGDSEPQGEEYVGHVDLILNFDSDAQICIGIGGNLSDDIQLTRRDVSRLRGVIRIPYGHDGL